MNKLIVTVLVCAVVFVAISGIVFAPDFVWQFFYNMKTPISILAVITAIVGAGTIIHASEVMRDFNKVSEEYEIYSWRKWTAVNAIMVVGLSWLLVQAIPSPEYKKEIVVKYVPKIVEKPVVKYAKERVVYHTPTYNDAYNKCMEGIHVAIEHKQACHRLATEAALPPYRTRTVYQQAPAAYGKLFDQCMNRWKHKGLSINEVMRMTNNCRDFAREGFK